MKIIFIPTLLVLCLITRSFAFTCIQNYTQSSAHAFGPNEAVGQHVHSSHISGNVFMGAVLSRADNNPISGIFYVIPGESSNISLAIASSNFSSSTELIYGNATVNLNPSSSYTFLWVRDETGNSTDIWQGEDWMADSFAYAGSFISVDQAGSFCFAFANNVPCHSIVNYNDTSPNEEVTNSPKTIRGNQYKGVPLIITVWDDDLEISGGNLTVNVSVDTITGPPAYLFIGSSYVYVNVIQDGDASVTKLFNGPTQPMRDTLNVLKVQWGWSTAIRFRVTVTVYDHGQDGVCAGTGAYPCLLWTSSTTVFQTSGL